MNEGSYYDRRIDALAGKLNQTENDFSRSRTLRLIQRCLLSSRNQWWIGLICSCKTQNLDLEHETTEYRFLSWKEQ